MGPADAEIDEPDRFDAGDGAMQCDCARSLIEALTGSAADEAPAADEASPAPLGRCLWCGEPSGAPAAESLVPGR